MFRFTGHLIQAPLLCSLLTTYPSSWVKQLKWIFWLNEKIKQFSKDYLLFLTEFEEFSWHEIQSANNSISLFWGQKIQMFVEFYKNSDGSRSLKFRFSKKATKFLKICRMITWEIVSNFSGLFRISELWFRGKVVSIPSKRYKDYILHTL